MHSERRLPWSLEEEILSLIPPKSLARFRSVCKRWNALFNDSRFINNHLARSRPQFILFSASNICSVEVDINKLSIEVHNLPSSYFPDFNEPWRRKTEFCDGLMVHHTRRVYGTEVYNPWLRKVTWIKHKRNYCTLSGIGYDNSRSDNHYKIFSTYDDFTKMKVSITEVGSDACKLYKFASNSWQLCSFYSVSLNGNLYWIAFNRDSGEYFIQSFDFTMERFKPFSTLPSKSNIDSVKFRSLAVFRRDQLSFLEQNCETKDIEIWVTKRKIKKEDGEVVEWMKFMDVSVPNLSSLKYNNDRPSFFIDDKSLSLVLFHLHQNRQAYVYIAKGDMFHEIRINALDDYYHFHRTYFPSLMPVPKGSDGEFTFTVSTEQVRTDHFQFPSWIKQVGQYLFQKRKCST